MNIREKAARNRFIIDHKQNYPLMSDSEIIRRAHAKFGGGKSRQIVGQIWARYLGKYELEAVYKLKRKKK